MPMFLTIMGTFFLASRYFALKRWQVFGMNSARKGSIGSVELPRPVTIDFLGSRVPNELTAGEIPFKDTHPRRLKGEAEPFFLLL